MWRLAPAGEVSPYVAWRASNRPLAGPAPPVPPSCGGPASVSDLASCVAACERCAACRAVSFSLHASECRWFRSCDVDTLTTQHRFFTTDTIPGGTYPGQNPVRTLSVGAQWVVSARAPEEQIFLLTQALWNPANRGLLTSGHASGQFIRLRTALRGIAIPLHPGAQRFYRDAGLLPS